MSASALDRFGGSLFLSEKVYAYDADTRGDEYNEVDDKADDRLGKDVITHPAQRIEQIDQTRCGGTLLRNAECVEECANGREDLGKGARKICRDCRADNGDRNEKGKNGGVRLYARRLRDAGAAERNAR